jgi:hypothetical protein
VAPVGLDCSRETYRTVLRLNRVKTRPRCQVRADDRTGPRPPAVAYRFRASAYRVPARHPAARDRALRRVPGLFTLHGDITLTT